MDEGRFDNLGSRDLPSINPFPQANLGGDFSIGGVSDFFSSIVNFFNFSNILLGLKVLLVVFIITTFAVGIYFYILQQEERSKRLLWLKKYIGDHVNPDNSRPKTKWEHVKALFSSRNESDWRLGIIEADAMLDDLTIRLGYDGNTLGERLKYVNPADFPKRNVAWQAHLIRNKIAHQGTGFNISRIQALRVMRWYEEVFTHSRYI